MRISVAKHSGVPVVEQIATQILLAIISGEIKPEHRLPSIRALATRLGVHPNSVRAAYLDLENRSWIVLRRGSGAYVKAPPAASGSGLLVQEFVKSARAMLLTDKEILGAVQRVLSSQPIESVLVVEPEPEMREILMAEISDSVRLPVSGADQYSDHYPGALVVALAARAQASAAFPASVLWLQVNSPTQLFTKQERPSSSTLVAFVSGSPQLLQMARTVLVASGWDPDALVLKDARQPNWKRGLESSALVIADRIVMREMPPGVKAKQLPVISAESLLALKERCNSF